MGFFLFQGTTLLGSYPFPTPTAGDFYNTATFKFNILSGTTSSTTYGVYYAPITGTSYILSNGGTAFYGSSATTSLTFSITEIA